MCACYRHNETCPLQMLEVLADGGKTATLLESCDEGGWELVIQKPSGAVCHGKGATPDEVIADVVDLLTDAGSET